MGELTSAIVLGGLFFSVLISSTTLCAACFAYNRLAQATPPLDVPIPSPRKAIGISVLSILVVYGIQFILGLLKLVMSAASKQIDLPMYFCIAIASFFTTAVLISWLLPTSPRRAILVALLQTAMQIVVAVLFAGILTVVAAR
jgi:hypothetical protein